MKLRTKLLQLYIDRGRINEAYTHAIEVEKKAAYPHSLHWYQSLLEVFGVSTFTVSHYKVICKNNVYVKLLRGVPLVDKLLLVRSRQLDMISLQFLPLGPYVEGVFISGVITVHLSLHLSRFCSCDTFYSINPRFTILYVNTH